jgi:2,5-dichloro-2,5-cyclohexadiene-1,4-diol dehydrogenase 1
MQDLTNKSIVVTGGGSGMGREASLLLARAGALVTVADVGDEAGKETVQLIEAAGGTAQFVHTDIADEGQVEGMVAAAVSSYGRLDGAFNNAAIPQLGKPLHELSYSEVKRTFDINALGPFLCLKYEITAMLKTGGGAIVNTASTAGVVAFPSASEYISSKHAVVGFTKAAAIDYATKGIRVNTILPGATLTPMLRGAMAAQPGLEEYLMAQQPIGRLAQPHEMATAVLWLLSEDASFVTGASIPVDGGFTAI